MSSESSKDQKDLKAILFPHSWLPEDVQREICAPFPVLTICKPWFMDEGEDEEAANGGIHIVRPPEAMRPPADFLKLLAEYRLWMRQNPGYPYLPTQQDDIATWEIRRSLRQNGDEGRHPLQEEAIPWHLILHLEREVEESRSAANEMLLRAKAGQAPLAEALGEEVPPHGLLDDLSPHQSYPAMEERRVRQVIGAWLGLFGPSIPWDGVLLTMTPEVLSFAAELFEVGPIDPPTREGAWFLRAIHLPRSSPDLRREKDPAVAGLSGKTVILAARE